MVGECPSDNSRRVGKDEKYVIGQQYVFEYSKKRLGNAQGLDTGKCINFLIIRVSQGKQLGSANAPLMVL